MARRAVRCRVSLSLGQEHWTYLECPEDNGGKQVSLRYQVVKMDPEKSKCNHDHRNVQMKEGLIKCMADWGGRVQHESDKAAASLIR